MSISNSLSNALSGMTAASRMAEVVSSNLSNSLTDGYGRRSLNRLSILGTRLDGLAQGLNDASSQIQTLRAEADASISDQVDQLNTALLQVEKLNSDITRSRNSGVDPSGFMDQRQRVIDTIAEIVPVRELERDGGQVALMTPSGESLIDGKAKQFGFVQNTVITPDMTLASGGLSSITLDGAPIGSDGIGKLAGGSLGFQDPTVDTTLVAGQAGLLTDNGTPFDVVNTGGLAGRIALNAAVDPAQGGALTNLRDGINAVAPGPSGDASLLQSLSAALAAPLTTAGDPIQNQQGHSD